MSLKPVILSAQRSEGPQSYFTDLDPADSVRDPVAAVRSLKLQLLLKTRIIVGASSLFHTEWMELFRDDEGLVTLLNHGVVVPALRDEFKTVDDFFENKKTYHEDARIFFNENAGAILPWSLRENSGWFLKQMDIVLRDPASVLRAQTGMAPDIATNLADRMLEIASADDYPKREHVEQAATEICPEHAIYTLNFAGLVYRVSGARVVGAEGHFPQGNVKCAGITPIDGLVGDNNIFWDMFVDATLSYMNSAMAITMERLDRLSFKDIVSLRADHLSKNFIEKFDQIIAVAKSKVGLHDPEALFLTCEELTCAAEHLKAEFYDVLGKEIKARALEDQLVGIYEVSTAALDFTPAGSAIGVLTHLFALPEMTALINKKWSDGLRRRLELAKSCLARVIGLPDRKRTALLGMYEKLLLQGFR